MATAEGRDGLPLVVTGSSAGGIQALSALVSGLPAEFPAPIVVAQHLDPMQQSRLGEILRARSTLPVVVVNDRERLLPATLYVVPSGHDVEITDGEVAVNRDRSPAHPQPSVDRLFSSAAAIYGERLVGIILSGMGSDGVAGARSVKEHGGTIVIQEPSTASFPAMPMALAPGLVDLVAKPEEMGFIVRDLLNELPLGEDASESSLRAFLGHVRERSGIDFLQYKMPTIRRRLTRLMAAAGVENLRDYSRYLAQNPEHYQRLISTFLIKVTGFFRDASLFDYLRVELLPQLIEEARGRGHELRIWSAGCATGEEAYSLAVLVAELLEDRSELSVRVFATDLDNEAISFARRGIYPSAAFEGVPQELIDRYFVRLDDAYEVSKRVRGMTVFGQHDLGQRAPFPRIDLILCRNVLIYFTKELQQRTIQLFAFSIRENGYLILGKAEMTSPAPQFFKPVHTVLKIFRREGERALMPPTRVKDALPEGATVAAPSQITVRLPESRPSFNGVIGSFVFNSEIGVIMVDRSYDVLAINAAARTMFNIHGVGIGEDLVHLARNVDANVLREVIDATLRGEVVPLGREIEIRAGSAEIECYVQMAGYPDKSLGGGARIDRSVLILLDVSAAARRRRALEEKTAGQEGEIASLRTRLDELMQRQRSLLEANEELTVANAELRTLNEQLAIASEEAASSTEEIETLNEEMQASNEELETLNEELQATIEELNTTNDELEARTSELVDQAHDRDQNLEDSEHDRERLLAILNVLPDPLALFRADGRLFFANHAFAELPSDLVILSADRSYSVSDVRGLLEDGTADGKLTASRKSNGAKMEYVVTRSPLKASGASLWLLAMRAPKDEEIRR